MNHGILHQRLGSSVTLALVIALHSLTALAGDDIRTALIAHPSVVNDQLDDQEVQNAYLGKKTQWNDGKSMTLVTLNNETIHESFLRHFIKKTPSQFRLFWKKMEFTGKGVSPRELDTEDEVIEFVKTTQGAVAYVSAEKASSAGCKILAIHGE